MVNHKIEFIKRLITNRGYMSLYFVIKTKNNICELENPLILLANIKVVYLQPIYKHLEFVVAHNMFFMIDAEDVDFELLATLI